MPDLTIYSCIEISGRRQGYITTYVTLDHRGGDGQSLSNPSLEDLARAIEKEGHRRVTLVVDESIWGGFDLMALVDLLNRRSALDMGEDSQKPETNAEVSTYEFNLLLLGPVDYRLDRVNCFTTLSLGSGSFDLDLLGPAVETLGDEDALAFTVASDADLEVISGVLKNHRPMCPVFCVLGKDWSGSLDVIKCLDDNGLEDLCLQVPISC